MSASPHLVSDDRWSRGLGPEHTGFPLLEEEREVGQGVLGWGCSHPPLLVLAICCARSSPWAPGTERTCCPYHDICAFPRSHCSRSAGSHVASPTPSPLLVASILFLFLFFLLWGNRRVKKKITCLNSDVSSSCVPSLAFLLLPLTGPTQP